MSEQAAVAAAPYPQHLPYMMVPVRERNGLGVVGFLIALVGLVIPTGIVALLGLLISLVALGRAPRAFAGLGVIIGLFGTVIWLALMILAVFGVLAAGAVAVVFAAGAFILTQPEIIEVTSDMLNTTMVVVEYEKEHDELPGDVSALGLGVSTQTDPWGNAYQYTLVDAEPGFDIVSSGGDGEFGTDDDMALSRLDEVWEHAFDNFGSKIEDLCERLERLEGTNIRFDQHVARQSFSWSDFDHAKRYREAALSAASAEVEARAASAVPERPASDIDD
ncbi:MAG: type II secretion system protein GspG [Phycisphaerales bacterium]